MLDDTKLVWDLQRVNQIALSLSTTLEIEDITRLATDGLVQYFDCVFARIWLVEPNRKMLKLSASSGLYTRTNGEFSRISMGDLKIGRIAQNRVSLLSNHLVQETWLRHPEWAIANKINGFAGYPLASTDKVIGVLATFSHDSMTPEFLKVLSSLCTTLTVALEMASRHQQEKRRLQANQAERHSTTAQLNDLSLSDSLAHILGQTTLVVFGTERSLSPAQAQIFIQAAKKLKSLECTYCRLAYEDDSVSLEAIAATAEKQDGWETSLFKQLSLQAASLGGVLTVNTEASIKAIQVSLIFTPSDQTQRLLSQREQEVIVLLTTGLRDRDIAKQLHISDSTVKFHINNILAKLKAKTRLQALYELMRLGELPIQENESE